MMKTNASLQHSRFAIFIHKTPPKVRIVIDLIGNNSIKL